MFTHDYPYRFCEFYQQIGQWLERLRIVQPEDICQNLKNAPEIFIQMLEGRDLGKVVVQVAEDKS